MSKCLTCQYRTMHNECRRFPPTVYYGHNRESGPHNRQEEVRFPTVKPEWWCGEYIPKDK